MTTPLIDAEIIFYRQDGKEHVFVSNDLETLNKKVAELEFAGYMPDRSQCMYKWGERLYLRTTLGAPWVEFVIPLIEQMSEEVKHGN